MMIRDKRITLGLTQADVAKQLRVHTQFISNIERGRAQLPLKYYKPIAKLLRLEINKLLDERLAKVRAKLEKAFGISS